LRDVTNNVKKGTVPFSTFLSEILQIC